MIVVVDDERTLPFGLHARTPSEAYRLLRLGRPIEELWLDHDLGSAGDTRAIALWLAEMADMGRPPKVGIIYVHSMNPVGAEWLMSTLSPHYKVKRAILNA